MHPSQRAMKTLRHSLITVLFCLLFWHSLAPSPLWAEQASESDIKAAYLLNFARFVSWPETAFQSSVAPLVLCVLGQGPLDDSLPTILYKRVQNRPLVILQIRSIQELPPCHMLFVNESEAPRVPQLLAMLKSRPVLTVSSLPEFSRNGGMITFVAVEHKIRFDVNLTATQTAGLTISSRLLNLARLVPQPSDR